MNPVFIVVLILTCYGANAQEKGIEFAKGLNWAQIQEKAKADNKYIFLDAYTTWCGPCKKMAKETFPQAQVGEFFNNNFINVAVQFDVTKNDNEEVKNWYKDAEALKSKYNVSSYPTYLFFNPAGEIVHMAGASFNPEDFMSRAAMALNPLFQSYTLKRQYEKGKRDSEFLLRLITATKSAGRDEMFLHEIINEYLSTQKDLLKQENLNFIITSTRKSTDPGFQVLINSPASIDSLTGTGKSADKVNDILFDEIILPLVRNGGSKIYHSGGMIFYAGALNKNVSWTEIENLLANKYPGIHERIIMAAKPVYYNWAEDWPAFADAVSSYVSRYESVLNYQKLNSYARIIFAKSTDVRLLGAALAWSEKTVLAEPENSGYLYTHASLLYKSGDKQKAIQIMEQARDISGDPNGDFSNEIAKMKKGEKTW